MKTVLTVFSSEINTLNYNYNWKYRNYSNISTPLEFRPQSFCQNYNYFFDSLNFDHPNLKKMNLSTIILEQNRPAVS